MNKSKEKLILFTRYPAVGKVKTRLIPELGAECAARVQELMTGHAVLTGRCHAADCDVNLEICFDGGSKSKMRRWLGKGLACISQGTGNLGQRMERAFCRAFKTGFERVVIIGCDCPEIDVQCLSRAFKELKDNDMVIGPAVDGGYYLIGLSKPASHLFVGIDWGSESVFEQTMKIAETEGLKYLQLKKLFDVDRPEDLSICRNLGMFEPNQNTISVIIATFNEEPQIQKSISSALKGALEVIVADGGSQDNTVKLAQEAGSRTLNVPYGRDAQFNTAAIQAKGDVLLFLHADTVLPETFDTDILEAVKRSNVIAGAFRLGINSDRAAIRTVETFTNLRSRLFQLPYGDQAIFMRRDVFLRLGGFARLAVMEDYEFVTRLRRRGRVATVNTQVRTSARRWLGLGVMRTTIINQLMISGYWLGVSPDRLAGFYRNRKKSCLEKNSKGKESKYESALLRAK